MIDRGALAALTVSVLLLSASTVYLARIATVTNRRLADSQADVSRSLGLRAELSELYAKRQAELHAHEVEAWDRVTDCEETVRLTDAARLRAEAALSASLPAPRVPGPLPRPKPKAPPTEEVWVQ